MLIEADAGDIASFKGVEVSAKGASVLFGCSEQTATRTATQFRMVPLPVTLFPRGGNCAIGMDRKRRNRIRFQLSVAVTDNGFWTDTLIYIIHMVE